MNRLSVDRCQKCGEDIYNQGAPSICQECSNNQPTEIEYDEEGGEASWSKQHPGDDCDE